MKKVRKLNIGKKLSALLLAGGIAFTLSACSGETNMKSLSPEDLLSISDVKDLTLVDELIDAGFLESADDLNVVEAAEQLENYLNKIDDLSSIRYTGVPLLEPLTKEQCAEALSLSDEDIEVKKHQCKYHGNNVEKQEQRLTALKMLAFLRNTYSDWVHKNGRRISIQYMMAAVKGAVADELDIPVEDYSKITIAERGTSPTDYEASHFIHVGDENDDNHQTYIVKPSQEELWNTIHYIYSVQEANFTGSTEFPTYRKALNYGKTTMAAGVNVKKDKLVAQNRESYIKKNYVKH